MYVGLGTTVLLDRCSFTGVTMTGVGAGTPRQLHEAHGACIYSKGNLTLRDTVIRDVTAHSTSTSIDGGPAHGVCASILHAMPAADGTMRLHAQLRGAAFTCVAD